MPVMVPTSIMRSGYSSRILLMSRVPIPEPVPPPREWVHLEHLQHGTDSRFTSVILRGEERDCDTVSQPANCMQVMGIKLMTFELEVLILS